MTFETTTHKDYSGAWRAESVAILGEVPEGTRKLELVTSKVRGGIAASANVFIYKDEGTGFSSKTTEIFGDFCKRGIAQTPCKRVTEKAVKEVHSRALLEMDAIVAEAKVFYENHDAEKAA